MSDISDKERDLFRDAVGDVRPIKRSDPRVESESRPEPEPRMTEESERTVRDELLEFDPEWVETGEELSFLRDGIQTRVLRRLRRGHYSVGDELDLHQMDFETAKTAIADFMRKCRERDIRCIRIIHGKGLRSPSGTPVLKSLVNGLLRRRSEVLAFTSARPEDGGTGAVYVLLKS